MQAEIFTDMLLYRRVNIKDLKGNVVRIKRFNDFWLINNKQIRGNSAKVYKWLDEKYDLENYKVSWKRWS